MNLGAFAVVIAFARRTRSAEISSYGGLGQLAPGFAVLMTVFLFSLAGLPPLAGWYAKFMMFRAVLDAGTPGRDGARRDRGGELGDRVLLLLRPSPRQMWFHPEPDDRADAASRSRPRSSVAIAICAAIVLVDRRSTRRCSATSGSSQRF